MNYSFSLPTSIDFGVGKRAKVAEYAKQYGSKTLLISGASALKNSLAKDIKEQLEKYDIELVDHLIVTADPSVEDVQKIIAKIARWQPNSLIAAGGGSVIDAAKAASVLHKEVDIGKWVGKTVDSSMTEIPLIVIPTTAGTGSEVTKAAIIKDLNRNLKSGIRGQQLYPKVAILDPYVLTTMPLAVMQETLFDAFTHLFETFLVRRAQPITESFSKQGLQMFATLMRNNQLNLSEIEFRTNIQQISLLGGINVGMAGSCLPHRLQQAMGSVSHVKCSHGRGLSVVYRAWLKQVYPFAQEKIDAVMALFEVSQPGDLIAKIQTWLSMPTCLGEMGYQQQHIPIFCEAISGDVNNDPIKNITQAMIEEIYLDAL
jgi:alcohol dehydrogenase class IV